MQNAFKSLSFCTVLDSNTNESLTANERGNIVQVCSTEDWTG